MKLVLDVMPHDADYYRARAIEERGRAEAADRVYLARLHRELAERLIAGQTTATPAPRNLMSWQRELPRQLRGDNPRLTIVPPH